jgi:hypothetical protein
MGGFLGSLLALSSVALTVGHAAAFVYLALNGMPQTRSHLGVFIVVHIGLFLHAAKTINIQSADFSAHSKALINALQAPLGWIGSPCFVLLASETAMLLCLTLKDLILTLRSRADTHLPFPQVFYVVSGVGLLVAAPPLAYGLGAGFLSRRQGRFRLQGMRLFKCPTAPLLSVAAP